MSDNPICPSCGAPITFASAQSLLAVCGHCRTTLIRRDLAVEQVGVMAALLEDATPLRLGTEGVWRGSHFAVVGRVQVRWDGGCWNEWYCVFDDGRTGWLGEAAGEYAVSFPATVPEPLPAWESLQPGGRVTLGGTAYEVTDVREAEVVGGEGELPFRVGAGWKTAAADLRTAGAGFATLDYSDDAPQLYIGEIVDLATLCLSGLREPEGRR
ncbi:MAG TPA: DUF4178 domain-containing protein [Methylomirabilota bacterium]|nr:DUF4178 domain-containing protein [Methylomirabilota bacterium]